MNVLKTESPLGSRNSSQSDITTANKEQITVIDMSRIMISSGMNLNLEETTVLLFYVTFYLILEQVLLAKFYAT